MKEHPTWTVTDSSKIDTYLECPRKFFYEYILGWRLETPPHDLHFGEAWHKAREYMLLNGYDDLLGAYSAFEDCYREVFPPETDELYIPKTPEAVLHAIPKFAEHYSRDLKDHRVLFTETSGTVPITEDIRIYFRMDSVIENLDTGEIFSWDHKSAKNFNGMWEQKFFLSVQAGTYTHCLYCMYPIDKVKGIEFCGTAFEFLKRGSAARSAGYNVSFKRVPVWKRQDQMNVWLWNVIDTYHSIMHEMERLASCREEDKVLQCFPMNTTSCTKYFGCMFHDFCMSWENPLQHCFEPPLGFIISFWDPREIKTTNKVDLEYGKETT